MVPMTVNPKSIRWAAYEVIPINRKHLPLLPSGPRSRYDYPVTIQIVYATTGTYCIRALPISTDKLLLALNNKHRESKAHRDQGTKVEDDGVCV
jgi:hypothetical protein